VTILSSRIGYLPAHYCRTVNWDLVALAIQKPLLEGENGRQEEADEEALQDRKVKSLSPVHSTNAVERMDRSGRHSDGFASARNLCLWDSLKMLQLSSNGSFPPQSGGGCHGATQMCLPLSSSLSCCTTQHHVRPKNQAILAAIDDIFTGLKPKSSKSSDRGPRSLILFLSSRLASYPMHLVASRNDAQESVCIGKEDLP
jgi:hypothetical protein